MTTLALFRDWWFVPRKESRMSRFTDLKTRLLADGSIDDSEVEVIRRELYADGSIDREEADFLVALRNGAKSVCPAFQQLFFAALKQYVLADGNIDPPEANWLREVLFADGTVDDAEKQFLQQLHTQARQVCPEFQQLLDDCLKK